MRPCWLHLQPARRVDDHMEAPAALHPHAEHRAVESGDGSNGRTVGEANAALQLDVGQQIDAEAR